ncbi:zf-HC2 domain-containing protein [Paenibacillus sp. IB182496]|uniref:Anti-sigma-W factor RsiW n=1 Tax=Paenibacillus sabuli TaxID=2772509 RepID=A0A927BPT3_9BACL|nr:zf-HC2 domain-containing protein [Paenibacillus sabuli]MBD2844481.1 zf-HC2 domain-containing protein [Paenibacillus sabuli]
MNCQEVMELMQRQLDGDLDERESEILTSHTRQCPDCADMYERLSKLSADLENLPRVSPSHSLVDAILPKLEELERAERIAAPATSAAPAAQADAPAPAQTSPTRARRLPWTKRWSTRAAGGALAAAVVVGLFIVTFDPALIGGPGASDNASYSADEAPLSSKMANQSTAADESMAQRMEHNETASGSDESSSAAPEDGAAGMTDRSTASGGAAPQETEEANGGAANSSDDGAAAADNAEPAGGAAADNAASTSDADQNADASQAEELPSGTESAPAAPADSPAKAPLAPTASEGRAPQETPAAPAAEEDGAAAPAADADETRAEQLQAPQSAGDGAPQAEQDTDTAAPARQDEADASGDMADDTQSDAPRGGAGGYVPEKSQTIGIASGDALASPGVPSPDGAYEAVVSGSTLQLRNAESGALLFESRKDDGRIVNVVWSDDGATLAYEVEAGEQSRQYVVNIANLSESAQ